MYVVKSVIHVKLEGCCCLTYLLSLRQLSPDGRLHLDAGFAVLDLVFMATRQLHHLVEDVVPLGEVRLLSVLPG